MNCLHRLQAPGVALSGWQPEAAADFGRAAFCEEQVACIMEADGQELEAAIHHFF
jgi:hypothetical protein